MKNGKYQIKDISDEEVYEAIRKSRKHYMENRFKFPTINPMFPYNYLKYPPKLILKKMERMCEQDKLEYGVSLRTAWIVGEENYPEKEEK